MSDNEWKPNETWQDALERSKEIRHPRDVKPVKWSCNPERKWVHLSESEWIALHDAFDAQLHRLMALQDASSDLHFQMSQCLEAVLPPERRLDLERWIARLEKGERGVWPPEAPTDSPSDD